MNWKPAFKFDGQEELGLNAQVFATQAEALDSARARFMVWTMPTGYDAVPTEDPVNYEIVDGRDTPLMLEVAS